MPEPFAGALRYADTPDVRANVVWRRGMPSPFSFLADPTKPNFRALLCRYAMDAHFPYPHREGRRVLIVE